MKFLIDNQLPVALAKHVRSSGHDCQHVLELGLAEAQDAVISEHAIENECVLITKDEDFVFLANRPGSKLKLIWVRLGNCRTPVLLSTFDHFWPEIEACLNSGDRIIELR